MIHGCIASERREDLSSIWQGMPPIQPWRSWPGHAGGVRLPSVRRTDDGRAGTSRILALGDSLTAGYGLSQSNSFHRSYRDACATGVVSKLLMPVSG